MEKNLPAFPIGPGEIPKQQITKKVTDMEIQNKHIVLTLDEETLLLSVQIGDMVWKWHTNAAPRLLCGHGTVPFAAAESIQHNTFRNGIGFGIESLYKGYKVADQDVPYAFSTRIWIEESTGHLYLEWIPLEETGLNVQKVFWPGEMEFDQKQKDWYTLLNVGQGLLVPNDWPTELGKPFFDGFFGTAGSYMPWFGQVRGKEGYLAICETPWDAGWQAEHPENSSYTHVGVRFQPTLGKMSYRRVMQYRFFSDCSYNTLCKAYRDYVQERGQLVTLAQKAVKAPEIDQFIGSSVVHIGIKSHMDSRSFYYDTEHPENNDTLVTFQQREKLMQQLHQLDAGKLYLHLDGWGQPGYDNGHPDYCPACEEAGGWEGLRSLAHTVRAQGDLFALHDQYRDFYHTAASYDSHYSCVDADGTIPGTSRWAGGPQDYLCATQASYYLRRNFSELHKQQIPLNGMYLDVFTCNEGDECANPMHRMTRRECYDYRNHCFEFLLSRNIVPSSEEVSDWSLGSLALCHYAPHEFMLRGADAPRYGLPVPLFSLVYHDCILVPWMMEEANGEDYMLYALLNGGMPYLIRESPSDPDTFVAEEDASSPQLRQARDAWITAQQRAIGRCRTVTGLHQRVAKLELVRHQFLTDDGQKQQSVFADGTTVTVDFTSGSYQIQPGTNQ